MASRKFTPEQLRELRQLAARWARIVSQRAFGDAGPGLLSFPLRGYTLALDIPAAGGLVPFLHELDRMTLDHGGRIYLAKDAVLRAGDFAVMYPKLEPFRVIQRRLDPQGLLSSSLARRLAIVEKQ